MLFALFGTDMYILKIDFARREKAWAKMCVVIIDSEIVVLCVSLHWF